MTTISRLKQSLLRRKGDMFLRKDFKSLGSSAQVGRALAQLQQTGVIVRIGLGVDVRAKPSVLTGKPIPVRPIEVLVPEVLARFGMHAAPSRQTQEYNDGISSQVPAGVVINTGKHRVRRKLGFNGKLIQYERA